MKELIKIWDSTCALGPTLILGDINIDQHTPNDPATREGIKEVYKLLEDAKDNNNLTLLNRKPTRHRQGNSSSLLDMFLTNTQNHRNPISDHDSVSTLLHSNDLTIPQQFFMHRDYKNLNFSAMEPFLTKNINLMDLK